MKYSLLGILFCLVVTAASAQEVYSSSGKTVAQRKREAERKKKDKGFDPSRLVYGGGLGLAFGGGTDVGISPILGYRFNERLTAGIGLGYEYLKTKSQLYDSYGQIITRPVVANIITPSVWGRYIFWRNIFAHLEYEHKFASQTDYYNNNYVFPPTIEKETINVNQPALLVGLGIRQPISDRVSFSFVVLYDLLADKYGFYSPSKLDYRLGINAGF